MNRSMAARGIAEAALAMRVAAWVAPLVLLLGLAVGADPAAARGAPDSFADLA